MTPVEFCYWLMGHFELQGLPLALDAEQTEKVKRHLALVFKHSIDPSQGSAEHQAELQEIHDGESKPPPPPPPRPRPPRPGHSGHTVYRC